MASPRRAPSSLVVARKGNGDWGSFSGIQHACELHWSVARLLEWLSGAMLVKGGLPTRAQARRQWRVAEEGKGERGRATAGSLVLFIGWRAPGRSEWHLGKLGLARDGSTVRWQREQRRGAWRGGVAPCQKARGACQVKGEPASRTGGVFEVHRGPSWPWAASTVRRRRVVRRGRETGEGR